MSVKVTQLTKVYGTQRAVDDISFTARPGEVLGFLGPNGAGKSTTMKMITCFLPPTTGEIEVAGFNTATDSLEVRRRVGYLPEHNPVYRDMYVREYLQFTARLNRIARPGQRIDTLIEQTGLGREQHKLISALSKGYRQRVGLAQALLPDPPVLILDEPTSGLDPNQLAEIRALIKRLGQDKTVIFSTHIMQEVQAICDRVIIINRGRLVADDPIDRLQARLAGQQIVTVTLDRAVAHRQLAKIPGVEGVETVGGNRYRLTGPAKVDSRPEVFRFAVANDLVLLEMQQDHFTVEDVFRRLTAEPAKPTANA
jgi:ABC-2 type transport system ATP-binding protein